MVWLIIWFVLAAAILVLTFWTYAILMRQKSTWANFAERHSLNLGKNGVFQSPDIEGMFKDLHVSIFSERQTMPDGRGQQYRTVIQYALKPNMPTDGVIASRYFTPFVENLNLPKAWPLPKAIEWEDEQEPLARARVVSRVKTYITKEREKALQALINFKRANFVFIFDQEDAFLRVESSDPLDDSDRMDKIIRKVYQIAHALSVKEEEVEGFNKLAKREERVDVERDEDELDEDDTEEVESEQAV